MGLIGALFGLGPTIRETAEVFVSNRTKAAAQEHAEHLASLDQLGAEFRNPTNGLFDQFINGLNRVPRPALALGTIGLFTFAMADPVAFGIRMQGLGLVPDPLWWLLGAIVSFYFGARELHHFRGGGARVSPGAVADVVTNIETLRDSLGPTATTTPQPVGTASVPQAAPGIGAEQTALARDNAALQEWLDGRR